MGKNNSVRSLRVRFHGFDIPLYKKLLAIARKHEVSASRVAVMAIHVGLLAVDEELSGVHLDFQALGWSLTNEGKERLRVEEQTEGL